jgi:Flp pilus assembly protein TadD
VTGSHDQVGRAVRSAQAAFARGEVAEAAQLMSKALALAPDREDLKLEYERISKALAEKLATNYEEQAKFEAKNGKWGSAALSWAKVCEGRPDDATAHRHAAHALFKAGGDLRGAQKYAQQAVFLAPDEIEGRILLTQIYMTIGLKLNAKRELDTATKLDPENEIVKNLQADLKKADQKT